MNPYYRRIEPDNDYRLLRRSGRFRRWCRDVGGPMLGGTLIALALYVLLLFGAASVPPGRPVEVVREPVEAVR